MFEAVGVERGHADRFRDTFAVRLQEQGASPYDLAKLLANTVPVREKHYAPTSRNCRNRPPPDISTAIFGAARARGRAGWHSRPPAPLIPKAARSTIGYGTRERRNAMYHIPGTILRVNSTRLPGVRHWGVVDWRLDEAGWPRMWHSQKSDVLRCTDYVSFSSGQQTCEVVWVPKTYQEQWSVIERLRSKEGLAWNLATANCEQIVRWAVEGRAHSGQLAAFVAVAFFVGVGIWYRYSRPAGR